MNQIRFFYNFLLKTCFHHNIYHHQIHKKFFKISFLWIVIPAKMIVACSLQRRWIAEGTRHRPERLAWNNVDSHWPVCVDWTGGAFVRAKSLRSCQMNKCHFTIIMSCVQSTLRKIRWIFGQIRFSVKFGLRITVAFEHTLFFIAWIKFEFFIIFWLRHVFTITFVIIRYTKNFSKYPS